VADYLNALGVPLASEILNDLYTLKGRKIAKKGWMPAFIWHVFYDETYSGKRIFNAYRTNEEIITEVPLIISADNVPSTGNMYAVRSGKLLICICGT
jgi:hypothetical protein